MRTSTYIAYFLLTACLGVVSYIYYYFAFLFVAVFIFGTIDSSPLVESFFIQLFIITIPPLLFGLSAFGFYRLIAAIFEDFKIILNIKFGVIMSSLSGICIFVYLLPMIISDFTLPFLK